MLVNCIYLMDNPVALNSTDVGVMSRVQSVATMEFLDLIEESLTSMPISSNMTKPLYSLSGTCFSCAHLFMNSGMLSWIPSNCLTAFFHFQGTTGW